ncbi:hypothetical protein VARIO8X_50640 [Burkholderiales bacterium 8X]|nr:hypothetical protein VARIO8X_50640 [Burkholderiales bacterium 8X]
MACPLPPDVTGPSGFPAVLAPGGVRANSLRSNTRGPDPPVTPLLGGNSTYGRGHTTHHRRYAVVVLRGQPTANSQQPNAGHRAPVCTAKLSFERS